MHAFVMRDVIAIVAQRRGIEGQQPQTPRLLRYGSFWVRPLKSPTPSPLLS
jgi:hypothetical protein